VSSTALGLDPDTVDGGDDGRGVVRLRWAATGIGPPGQRPRRDAVRLGEQSLPIGRSGYEETHLRAIPSDSGAVGDTGQSGRGMGPEHQLFDDADPDTITPTRRRQGLDVQTGDR